METKEVKKEHFDNRKFEKDFWNRTHWQCASCDIGDNAHCFDHGGRICVTKLQIPTPKVRLKVSEIDQDQFPVKQQRRKK